MTDPSREPGPGGARGLSNKPPARRHSARTILFLPVAVILAAAALPAVAANEADGPLAYEPPAPGSYELPPITRIEDHPLRDTDERETTLFATKGQRLAVVGFIYRSCGDAQGCPLAMATFRRLDRDIAANSRLAGNVALLTISFDPERDTPERLGRWREAFTPKSPWSFLTADGQEELDALLADFGQTVSPLRDEKGAETGLYRHVLKVFLLDRENRVRNVYSAGFLNPALITGDLLTLLGEEG